LIGDGSGGWWIADVSGGWWIAEGSDGLWIADGSGGSITSEPGSGTAADPGLCSILRRLRLTADSVEDTATAGGCCRVFTAIAPSLHTKKTSYMFFKTFF
jgi:hypothetical protein